MNKKDLAHYESILLKMKANILAGDTIKSTEDLHISSDDLADEADLASSIINQQVSVQIREREINKLRLIEAALARIKAGTYGHCDDCDVEIEKKRLEKQPWAILCIVHAEERERERLLA